MKRIAAPGLVVALLMLTLILWGPGGSHGRDQGSGGRVPKGVYIELTRDFYETLRAEGSRDRKVYSNDPSLEYLRRIAVSAKFMVETNLEILKQQELMIQRLDALSETGKR